MVIRNATKGTILADNAVKATTFKHKAFGLILAPKGTAMIFQTRFGIHTFFMNYPIDIFILDDQNRVVYVHENMKPNRILIWNPKYETVIELPMGTITKTKTKKEDVIKIGKF